jgi:hypothetical protein
MAAFASGHAVAAPSAATLAPKMTVLHRFVRPMIRASLRLVAV